MSALVLHRGLGPGLSKCRCGARIVWARTTSGKVGPFQEDENGIWMLVNGSVKYIGPGPVVTTATRYSSHLASCPHRKTKT